MTAQKIKSDEIIPYLIGLSGSMSGTRINLIAPQSIIGRDPELCSIALDNNVISRRHAAIEINGRNDVIISDLGSTHGTFVNGEMVTKRILKDGDKVGFGPLGVVAFAYHHSVDRDAEKERQPSASSVLDVNSIREKLAASARLATTERLNPSPAPYPSTNRQASSPSSGVRVASLPVVRVGRAPDNEIVLDAPGVSRYHATLTYSGDSPPILTDLGSANGTYVNGEPALQQRPVNGQDIIFLGGFILRVDGRNIRRHDLSASRISAWQINKRIGDKTILKDISLAISPREFVGLMGPSGCGKSTLMDALNALRPATSGAVYINDLDLYHNFDALRRSIGHVPQRDILHDALSVERTLYYAAKLRLPDGTPKEQAQHTVNEVIQAVGLEEFRSNQFRQLSGGQQKRLSLAIELITKPNFIFLDEPTSPLDPETTENMMLLFRKLADEGRIIVMVTHRFEKFDLMHQVAILTKGGRLAFFGPPQEAMSYFHCHEPADIYRNIAAREPDEISQTFRSSSLYQHYITDRIAEAQEIAQTTGQLGASKAGQRGTDRKASLAQWLTLTRRYLEIKLKDTRNTMLLVLQAPVIAFILSIITGNALNDGKALFIAAIISIWFGANNAIREIVSETPIYMRERLINLKIPSYVFSKFTVLSGVALVQCLLFVGILVGLERFSGHDFLMLVLTLYLTSLCGIAMGLACSALVNSTEKAMSILPLILIPQLLLSGFLKPIDDLYVTGEGKATTAVEYRRYEDTKGQQPVKANQMTARPPMPVIKHEGLGAATYAADLMVARWSIDALAHVVSIDDKKARDRLAAQMTITSYDQVLKQESESNVIESYRSRVLLDSSILGAFAVILLTLTILALKRKDTI